MSAQFEIAECTFVVFGVVQKRRAPPVPEQSASEVQPTGAQTWFGPHTVPLNGWPAMSPDGLQSRSTMQGMPQAPFWHLARAFPSSEKHWASLEHGDGTQSLFVVSQV